MKKEALLVIDMLNDFVLPGAPLEVLRIYFASFASFARNIPAF